MDKMHLKLKIVKLSKTLNRNELYDYIIAKYFASDRVSNGYISVADIEEVTGIKIKDVEMMNKLLFYWTNFLTHEELLQKVVNILTVIDFLPKEQRDEIVNQHREDDTEKARLYRDLKNQFKDVA